MQSVYLGLRGLRTLKVRLDAVGVHTRKVVDWLLKREEVKKVIWPAYEKDPGYRIYKRDYSGRSDYLLSNFRISTRMSRSTALWIL